MGLGHNIYDGKRTQDIQISQDVTFESMLLKSNTLQGLRDAGFYKPSPIQLHGIPLGKCGFDLLLEAKSGTGKTAVFTVIALEKIDLKKGLQVIILAPTREIAMQIHDVVNEIGCSYEGLQVEVVMGGLSVQDDIEKFKKSVHIVVGSPGRLKHLIKDKFIDTSAVRMLVLDEADKLMEKSFQSDIKYINSSLPQQKQIIMSSATYPESSKTFIQDYVQNAQLICPDSNNILLGIEQKLTTVKHHSNIVKLTHNKFIELLKILSNKQFKQGLIFCNYQARVGEIHKMLSKEKWPAEQLFGMQEQTDRLDALKTLQEYKCRLLVSTDLAARGIDASNVDLVINFEPPYEWQTYLHRIGRAGRFGSYGTAITILSEGVEEKKFKTLLESIKIPFDLTYLWSNEQFSVNSNENGNEKNITTEYENHIICHENLPIVDSDTNLWNALTNDIKVKKSLENFDSLCQAFNRLDTESEIEIFDDLLQSFQSSEYNNSEENEFLKMELLELPVNEYNIDSSKICKNINNNCLKAIVNQESLKERELDDIREKENQLVEINHEINSEFSGEKLDIEKVINPVDSCIKESYKKNGENCLNDSELLVSVYNEIGQISKSDINTKHEGMRKALDDFGLPTAFSSAKWSNNTQNKINTDNKTRNTNLLYCKNPDKQVNKKKPTKQKLKIEVKGNENDIEPSYDSYAEKPYRKYNISSADNVEIQRHSHLQSNSNVRNKRKEISKQKSKYQHLYNNSHRATCHKEHKQNYLNWYNILKLRMKQIEMFVYLNEINNL